jgi:hypothetical protein
LLDYHDATIKLIDAADMFQITNLKLAAEVQLFRQHPFAWRI